MKKGLFFCCLICVWIGCLSVSADIGYGAEKISVFAGILPQQYFLERIGGERLDVTVMVEPGANPASYEPKPLQMAKLSKALAYFAVGVPFENAWLDRITGANSKMKVVRTDAGIDKKPMAAHHHESDEKHGEHENEGGEGHENGEIILDPHIWLSPQLVMKQAENIVNGLCAVDEAGCSRYKEGYARFLEEIEILHKELQKQLEPHRGSPFMVFHPSWGYFAEAYGLRQIPAEIEGKRPKPAELKDLIQLAQREKIRTIFVQPQFSTQSAKIIAKAIRGKVLFIDPLAQDWTQNLRDSAEKISNALKAENRGNR